MTDDMTPLETELRLLIPAAPSAAIIDRICDSLSRQQPRSGVADWTVAAVMIAGAASAVVILMLFAAQERMQRPAPPPLTVAPRMVQGRQVGTNPYLAVLGRRDNISSAEFAGLLYP